MPRTQRNGSWPGRIGFAGVLAIVLSGCGESPDQLGAISVRDSAGVRIIEVQPRPWPPPEVWRIDSVPLLNVGVVEGDSDYEFYQVVGVLSRPDGGVVAGEFGARLRYYDGGGRHVRTLDLEGEGPGEARSFQSLRAFRGDSLAIETLRATGVQSRIELMVLDADGNFGRKLTVAFPGRGASSATERWIPGGEGFRAEPLDDGSFVGITMARLRLTGGSGDPLDEEAALVRMHPGEGRADSIATVRTRRFVHRPQANPPYEPMLGAPSHPPLRSLGDRIYRGHPGRFAVDIYEVASRASVDEGAGEGDGARFVRSIRIEVEEELPAERWRTRQIDHLVEMDFRIAPQFDSAESRRHLEGRVLPDPLPVAQDLIVDAEGNLWFEMWQGGTASLRRFVWMQGTGPDEEPTRWVVSDPEGALIGSVVLPPGLEVHEVGSDYVLGVYYDDLGVPYLRRYGLFKP